MTNNNIPPDLKQLNNELIALRLKIAECNCEIQYKIGRMESEIDIFIEQIIDKFRLPDASELPVRTSNNPIP